MSTKARGQRAARKVTPAIPVIDLFAGPGGLGEGFSAFRNAAGTSAFRIALSIEKDSTAHATLRLRSFFRKFEDGAVPPEYYDFVKSAESRSFSFESSEFSAQFAQAHEESWCAELGLVASNTVAERVRAAAGRDVSVLIGGPPCQAYSLVGRSRNHGNPDYNATEDGRHFLYKEYLKVLATHWPAVFVMENVKGLLSAKVDGQSVFVRILEDLHSPATAIAAGMAAGPAYRYRVMALTVAEDEQYSLLEVSDAAPSRFIVRSEDYGIPQARHRLILLGIREDIPAGGLRTLQPVGRVSVNDVLASLPKLRSGLSDGTDSLDTWRSVLASCTKAKWFKRLQCHDSLVAAKIAAAIEAAATQKLERGAEFMDRKGKPKLHHEWYSDPKIGGVLNHSTRSHMPEDLKRYLFASAFASVHNRSPTLVDFPSPLLPAHGNVKSALDGSMFSDRFRVQVKGRPSTTVTSHIAKDGHYYIHYDPSQCRSLTAREAARLQTFPDNYFFCGGRTAQYHQIGNAVPPLLARQIASIVAAILL
jgi:DNA (cytosine-5)-methyltransferase 1